MTMRIGSTEKFDWTGFRSPVGTVCCSQGREPNAIYFERNGASHR